MKHIFTLGISMLLSAATASAQPAPLTAATHMPNVGTRNQVHDKSAFLPGTAGANQTWDFSAQTFNAPKYGTFQACNLSNGCSNYPGTTMVYVWSGLYHYYKDSANVLSLTGFHNGMPNVYSNPEDYMRFPMGYGSSFTDSFASWYPGSPAGQHRRGVDSVSVDGWGTLMTPAGTFPNTLRIKNISTYQDSSVMDPIDKTKYKIETYTFYDAAHRNYLYTTANIVVTPKWSSPQTINYARYTSNWTVSIASTLAEAGNCRILQNPAKGSVLVGLHLSTATEVSLQLTDITGRVVRSLASINATAGENKISLPAEGLPGGIYTLRVMAGDEAAALKVVLQ